MPGVFWLGDCLEQIHQGRILHGYNSTYLVVGERSSLLVEAGHPQDLLVIERQLDSLLSGGLPPLEYIFPTHEETPHAPRLDELVLDELAVELVCPTHGLPITDLEATMPRIREGLRLGSAGVR